MPTVTDFTTIKINLKMITTISPPDPEELSEAVCILAAHMKYTPLKLLEELFLSEYLNEEDVAKVALYLGLPYEQIRRIIEDI